jgi:hypothetical protein
MFAELQGNRRSEPVWRDCHFHALVPPYSTGSGTASAGPPIKSAPLPSTQEHTLKPVPAGIMASGSHGWDQSAGRAAGFAPPPQAPMFDAELAQIFLKMRTLLGVGLWDMARMVGGEPAVIADLEAGSLSTLPPWPELTRLVGAYAALTGIDPQPILARLLRSQPVTTSPRHFQPAEPLATPQRPMSRPVWGNGATWPDQGHHVPSSSPDPRAQRDHAMAKDVSTVPTAARRAMPGLRRITQSAALATRADHDDLINSAPRKAGRLGRAAKSTARGLQQAVRVRAVGVGILAGMPAALLLLGWLVPATLYAAAKPLPPAVAAPIVWCLDHLVTLVAPARDGLIWIDIGDPRLRKADRLPEQGR